MSLRNLAEGLLFGTVYSLAVVGLGAIAAVAVTLWRHRKGTEHR